MRCILVQGRLFSKRIEKSGLTSIRVCKLELEINAVWNCDKKYFSPEIFLIKSILKKLAELSILTDWRRTTTYGFQIFGYCNVALNVTKFFPLFVSCTNCSAADCRNREVAQRFGMFSTVSASHISTSQWKWSSFLVCIFVWNHPVFFFYGHILKRLYREMAVSLDRNKCTKSNI